MSEVIDAVGIVNEALIKIAEAPIDSLDNAQSKSSRTMKALLPQACRYIFKLHPWNCLRERTVLIKSGDVPAFGYACKYALPVDCLRPLAVQTTDGSFIPFYSASYGGTLANDKQFVIEGKYLLTDEEPHTDNNISQTGLNFVYIKNPENLNILDANLIELLACHLAALAAYTFTGSVNLAKELRAEKADLLKTARAANAQEIAPGIPVGAVLGAHW